MIPSKREIKKEQQQQRREACTEPLLLRDAPKTGPTFSPRTFPLPFWTRRTFPSPQEDCVCCCTLCYQHAACIHCTKFISFSLLHSQGGENVRGAQRGEREMSEGRCVEGKYPTLQDCSIGMDFTAIFATSLVCWAGFGDNRELCRNGRTDRDAVWGVGQTLRGPRSHLLDGSAHWRHLVNTTKQSVCGGDAVLRQITLATSLLWRSCSTCSTRWHCSTSRCCSSMLSRSPGNRSRS